MTLVVPASLAPQVAAALSYSGQELAPIGE